jgi:hypothetical protein
MAGLFPDRHDPRRTARTAVRGTEMDPAYISAIAALSGSVIGGFTSLAASWISQNAQARMQQRLADKTLRQQLYKSFIEEASRLYADALVTDKAEVTNLVSLYAMVSRMRISSEPPVVQCADAVVRRIIETYLAPNQTFRDIRNELDDGRVDVLRPFSEACRQDLREHPWG